MPKIPSYSRTQSITGEGPSVPEPIGSAGVVGESIQKLGQSGTKLFQEMEEAQTAVEALKLEYGMKTDFAKLQDSYAQRIDYDKFDEDSKKDLDTLRAKYVDSVSNGALKQAADRAFLTHTFTFENKVRQAKISAIKADGHAQWVLLYNQAMQDYSKATSDEEREVVASGLQMKGDVLVSRKIKEKDDVAKDMLNFKAHAEEAYIRGVINDNPDAALEELDNNERLTGLDPVRRENLKEHAVVKSFQEVSRLDKLVRERRRENTDTVYDLAAKGRLDLEQLDKLWAIDRETGRHGLDGSFYEKKREELLTGKNIVTDPYIFDALYFKEGLTEGVFHQFMDRLSPNDQDVIRRRILQEKTATDRALTAQQRAEAVQRNAYARNARTYLSKALKGADPEEGYEVLNAFQACVDDPNIKKEDLQQIAEKLTEGARKGALTKIVDYFFGTSGTSKPDAWAIENVPRVETPAPATKRSLDDIFGKKK